MFFKNDSNQSLKSKNLANQLHEQRQIYYAYAALDALSSSYSMFKYFYDVCIGGNSDEMHEFMLTPQCIAGIALESFLLAGFFVLACHYDNEKREDSSKENQKMSLQDNKDDGDDYKKNIRDAGPYVRDILKGVKNAYKGWRSTIAAINLLHVVQLNALILPLGISLGVLGAINRCLIRRIRDSRKAMGDHNESLIKCIKELNFLYADPADLEIVFKKNKGAPQQQQRNERILGIIYASFGGFVDGLYLYAGALTLSVLAPQLLIAMGILCSLYTVACIVTRVDEEHKYQQKLIISYHKCWLSLYEKQIQTLHGRLLTLQGLEGTPGTSNKILKRTADLCSLIDQFDEELKSLRQYYKTNYGTAVLLGIKNSLFAYSALSSILFLSSSLATLGGVVFPPLIVVLVVCSGIALMAGFIIAAMRAHYLYKQEKNDELREYQALVDSTKNLKNSLSPLPSKGLINHALSQVEALKPEPEIDVQKELEVVRCFFSGLGKGQKFIDFSCNGLQEQAADGHYHDTPIMFTLSALSASLFGGVLALRALARGFGRTSKPANKKGTTETCVPDISSLPHREPSTPLATTANTTPETQVRPSPGRAGMFGVRRSFTENDLSNYAINITMDTIPLNRQHHTVADLTGGRYTS